MSNRFDDFLAEQLKDPELKKEYDALEPKYALIESIVMARKERNLTQKELSKLTGITQADLSKIENGNANPSLNTLLKLAKGLGKKLQVSLVQYLNKKSKVFKKGRKLGFGGGGWINYCKFVYKSIKYKNTTKNYRIKHHQAGHIAIKRKFRVDYKFIFFDEIVNHTSYRKL